LVLTGAAIVAKNPCPDMISYALAKNAVHALNYNLANDSSFKPTIVTILPYINFILNKIKNYH